MKFKKIFVMALMALAFSAAADGATMNLGYAQGEFTQGCPVGAGFGDSEWIDQAIYIPASTMKLLGGNSITGVNGCLTAVSSVETARIWLRYELDGEDLAEFTLKPNQLNNIKKGVNKFSFKTPWVVPENCDKGLYIGFGHKIKDGNARGLSGNTTPIPGAFYLKRADDKWYDCSMYGSACIEAVVSGENLPAVNLRLSRVDSPEHYIVTRGKLATQMYVHNFGTEAISAFDVTAELDGSAVMTQRINLNVAPGKMGVFNVTFSPEVTEPGENNVKYSVTNVAEGADADVADNSAECGVVVVSREYEKKVLAEEFTTEMCSNCPVVVEMIHKLLAKPEYKDVIQVCHHAGYKTDFLTEPWHEEYVSLYGGGSFAPGVCADRSYRDSKSIVYFPESESDITTNWDRCLANPALVSVNISAKYTDESCTAVEVKVCGEKAVAKLCENPTVTVWVTESGIQSESQGGAGKDFIHDNVSRAVGSASYWGDPVKFDNDSYEYSCVVPVSEGWNRDNLEIVAFIADNSAWNRRVVNNASAIDFRQVASAGVDAVGSDQREVAGKEYFDLTGKRVAAPSEGLYLIRVKYTDGTSEVKKAVVK